MRYKILSDAYYKNQMAKGEPSNINYREDMVWRYYPKNSSNEQILKAVCYYAEKYLNWLRYYLQRFFFKKYL